jgi:hypothetical protein
MSISPVVDDLETLPRRGGRPRKNNLLAHPVYRAESNGDVSLLGPTLAEFLATRDAALRLRYREQLTKTQALEELAQLRHISQMASEEINQRLQPEEDKCMVCLKPMPPGGKPIQMVIERDPATGTAQTKVLCSIACVQQRNKQRMGLAGAEHAGIPGDIK